MTPTLKRGASYQRALIVRDGDASAGTVRAVVKSMADVQKMGDAAPELAVFTASWTDHWDGQASSPPAWLLSLTPEQTALLPADDCATDARVSIGGFVVATQTERLRVEQRITGPSGG